MSHRFFAHLRRMLVLFALVLEGVTAPAEPMGVTGLTPIVLRATLPTQRNGPWEPLLSMGAPGDGDVIFCRRLTDGRVVFGWEQTGRPACLSDSVAVDETSPQEILISLGNLLPPAGDAAYVKNPALVLLRGIALIQCGTHTVLMAKGEFTPVHGRISPGKNEVGGSMAGAFYSGKIESIMPADLSAVLAAAIAPGRLIADDAATTAEARDFPGPLKLKVLFPGGGGGHNEPLVVTGITGRGDFIYVSYVDDRHLRLGFDHWLVGGPLAPPVESDVTQPHEVVVSMGSLLPPPNAGRPDSAAVAILRQRCVVLLDGKVVISTEAKFHPTKPEQITLFTNTIGGSTADPVFTGTILRAERVRPEEILRVTATPVSAATP